MPKRLQKQINLLQKNILIIGAKVEDNLLGAVKALSESDAQLASEIIESDKEIDQMEVDLEEECLKILALYQPVAVDLRYIIAILKINNDLERIGDLASNLARRARFAAGKNNISVPGTFEKMVGIVRKMLRESLDALVDMDAELAYHVCATDDDVDALHRENYKIFSEAIMNDTKHLECYINLWQASTHLERIADLATNIAEDVVYMIQGEIVRHNVGEHAAKEKDCN